MSRRLTPGHLQRAAAAQRPIDFGALADRKRQRNTAKVHTLGPRVLDELLAEIGAEFSIMTPIEQKLARYARLDPGALAALGGDQFPPAPLTVIDGGRDASAKATKGHRPDGLTKVDPAPTNAQAEKGRKWDRETKGNAGGGE